MDELKPVAAISFPWKTKPCQKSMTYSSFASIDIKAELLVSAKLFAQTYVEAIQKHGSEKLSSILHDQGIVQKSVYMIMHKNRTLMNSKSAVMSTAVYINVINMGILSIMIKLATDEVQPMHYDSIMYSFIKHLKPCQMTKKLIDEVLPFESSEFVFDIANIMYPCFTSVTNPSYTHKFDHNQKVSMKNTFLRIIEHTNEAKNPAVVNSTIHELFTNNCGILSQETRNYFFNVCSEYANFAFQSILQSQKLRDYLYESDIIEERFNTMTINCRGDISDGESADDEREYSYALRTKLPDRKPKNEPMKELN